MDKLYFQADERELMFRMLENGLLQKQGRDTPQWWAVRIAIAKSIQMDGYPDDDRFAPGRYDPAGSELHLDQVTGKGKAPPEDYTDAFRLLLSVHHKEDLFSDNSRFEELLHRHARRGLHEIAISWTENSDFFYFLKHDLFFDRSEYDADPDKDTGIPDATILSALEQIGVSAQIEERTVGPRLLRLKVVLSGIDDYENLRRNLDDLNFILGLQANSVVFELGGGERRVLLDVPKPMPTWHYIAWSGSKDHFDDETYKLPVCFATDVLGNELVFDLASAPHLLVGGTTGSGKSICIHSIILSLICADTQPGLVLIDPKSVELTVYEPYIRTVGKSLITDMSDATEILLELVEIMQERQQTYMAIGARDIDEAHKRGNSDRRIVVVVDELADLVLGNPEVVRPLVRLAQKARSFGIHLVLATQRPEAATFPGLLRSNIPSRIALTVQKNSESRIILDESGAENLLMRGDMLIRMAGKKTIRAHGLFVTRPDIERILSENVRSTESTG